MKMSENMHDPSRSLSSTGLPARQGLYDPAAEHDSCGVNFVVNMRGVRSHETVQMGLGALCKLEHRGAVGSDPNSGDGAGLLVQIPDLFCRSVVDFDLPPEGLYATGIGFLPQDAEAAALPPHPHAQCGGVAKVPCQGGEQIGKQIFSVFSMICLKVLIQKCMPK